jgi:hypothetical protein
VACPLDCPHLREARLHEKPAEIDFEAMPNRDIRVSEKLLEENEALFIFLARSLAAAALEIPGVVDSDVGETLAALIRTYRTRQSGLYYDSLPANALAASVYRRIEDDLERFRREEAEGAGIPRTRDGAVLAVLVVLDRLELDRANGRRKGRAFIDFLRGLYHAAPGAPGSEASPLLLP